MQEKTLHRKPVKFTKVCDKRSLEMAYKDGAKEINLAFFDYYITKMSLQEMLYAQRGANLGF